MKRFLIIFFLFSLVGNSQTILRVSQSGKVYGKRVKSFPSIPPSGPFASIAATDPTATESGATTGTFTVTLSSASSGTTTVNFIVSGSAASGSDYTAIGTSVDILDGNDTATITVTPIDDALVEANETVIVTLTTGSGYDVGSPDNATINITSDDSSGSEILASIVATDSLATEGSTATYTVSLSEVNSTGSPITVNYSNRGHATSGSDYTALSGSVSIPNGSQTATITLTATDDSEIEPYEAVLVELENGTGYSIEGYNKAEVFIVDNDTSNMPSVSGESSATTLADLTGSTYTGQYVTIDAVINATGATFDSGIVLRAGTGYITGTNINLNGAGIEDGTGDIFAPTVTFSSVYTLSRLRPEVFGAVSGDATDDNDAIDALINNVQHATATLNGSYIKNEPSYYTRSGTFDWDMNGAKVSTTSAASFNTTTTNIDYVFDFTNVNPYIYNGEFDGTDTYGRAIYMHAQQYYLFKDLYIHDYHAPTTYRAAAIRGTFQIDDDIWDYGTIEGCTIENIIADGNGNYNDSPAGVSKGFYFTMQGGHLASTQYDAVFRNNVVRYIKGDDAEAFYVIHQGGGSYNHDGEWWFHNEDYRYNTRRAMKVNISNVSIEKSYFEEVPDSLYVSAQQMGSMVDIFSISTTSDIVDIVVKGNTIKGLDNQSTYYHLLSVTEVNGCIIANNTISMYDVENYAGLRLGSGTSTYTGDLTNITIKNNTFNNCGLQWLTYYNPIDQLDVGFNTFNYDWVNGTNFGNQQAVMRTTNTTGTKGSVLFHDNDINILSTAGSSLFHGLLYSAGAAITNVDITDCTLDYSTVSLTNSVGWLVGNFGATNSITNLTVTGDASPTLNIDGTGGVVLSGNTPSITLN